MPPPLANLVVRDRLMVAVRNFFHRHQYLEIETPCRLPALLPEAHIEPQPAGNWFLQPSPEVAMKRLLSKNCPRLFQICKAFRRAERGRRHLPEFTLLEWYHAGADYTDLMAETEELIRFAADALTGGAVLRYQGQDIDLSPGWPRLTVAEAFDRHAGISLAEALRRQTFDQIMGLTIEPALAAGYDQPVFLVDYPRHPGGSLAREKAGHPDTVERVELYIAGLELANGFSELTGADNYRQRFAEEKRHLRRAGRTPPPWPESFLREIVEMPPAAGNALGLDRLAMLFCDATDIGAVVAFVPESL